jgi:hypothetical protein
LRIEKQDLINLLSKPAVGQAQPKSQTADAQTVDLSSWSDKEIALLARDRKVDISNLNRAEASKKIEEAVKTQKPSSLLAGWIGSHNGFRQAATNLEQLSKRLAVKGQASDAEVDVVLKQLEDIEKALQVICFHISFSLLLMFCVVGSRRDGRKDVVSLFESRVLFF